MELEGVYNSADWVSLGVETGTRHPSAAVLGVCPHREPGPRQEVCRHASERRRVRGGLAMSPWWDPNDLENGGLRTVQ